MGGQKGAEFHHLPAYRRGLCSIEVDGLGQGAREPGRGVEGVPLRRQSPPRLGLGLVQRRPQLPLGRVPPPGGGAAMGGTGVEETVVYDDGQKNVF